ncbi:hypothetical protein D6D24_10581 [Aureobasidium pullulans]|uniref:Uncharacterized protein n=1 Tax=Aureobasidium pullulans TaxID=5580 RepID=A0A4S8UZZ6_AURPU|nr:hypothetical protein D6D24_10581 [Aureobasidium pullulans]
MSFHNAKRYNMSRARTHVVVMKTLFMEKLAFRAMWTVAKPVIRYAMAISPEEISKRILYLALLALPPRDALSATEKGSRKPATSTNGVIGSRAYACKHDAKTINLISKYKGLKAAKINEKV